METWSDAERIRSIRKKDIYLAHSAIFESMKNTTLAQKSNEAWLDDHGVAFPDFILSSPSKFGIGGNMAMNLIGHLGRDEWWDAMPEIRALDRAAWMVVGAVTDLSIEQTALFAKFIPWGQYLEEYMTADSVGSVVSKYQTVCAHFSDNDMDFSLVGSVLAA